LHIVALTTDSAAASAAELGRNGIDVPAPAGAAREVHYPGASGTPQFRWFKLPDEIAGEGLFCFVEHLTRELVVRPELATHANGARDLAHLTLCVARPRAVIKRYMQIFGVPARQGKVGYWFDLANGKLRVVDLAQLKTLYPEVAPLAIRAHGKGRKRLWVHPTTPAARSSVSSVRRTRRERHTPATISSRAPGTRAAANLSIAVKLSPSALTNSVGQRIAATAPPRSWANTASSAHNDRGSAFIRSSVPR
jgi:hypothetical protein